MPGGEALGFCRHLPFVLWSTRNTAVLQGPPPRMLTPQQSCDVQEIYVLPTEGRHYDTGLCV